MPHHCLRIQLQVWPHTVTTVLTSRRWHHNVTLWCHHWPSVYHHWHCPAYSSCLKSLDERLITTEHNPSLGPSASLYPHVHSLRLPVETYWPLQSAVRHIWDSQVQRASTLTIYYPGHVSYTQSHGVCCLATATVYYDSWRKSYGCDLKVIPKLSESWLIKAF